MLPHIVTALDVPTVAWCCRQTQDFHTLYNAGEEHCKYQSDSGQQVSSLTDIAMEVSVVCLLKIGVLSRSTICRPITHDHLFPHCAAAQLCVSQTAPRFLQLK